MAQQQIQLDGKKLCCSICLDLLKDPVTIPCGHSYCRICIQTSWAQEDENRVPRCPQCRQVLVPRPVLVKNTILADLVEELKKAGPQAAPAGPEDAACDLCAGRKLRALKSCLTCLGSYCEDHLQHHCDAAPLKKHKLVEPSKELQESIRRRRDEVERREEEVKVLEQEAQAVDRAADRAAEDCGKIFTQLIRLIEKRSSRAEQQIRSQQRADVGRVRELREKLEREIADLRARDADPDSPPQSPLGEAADASGIKTRALESFEDVTADAAALGDKLRDILGEEWTESSQAEAEAAVVPPQTEPKTRTEFLTYSREITLDPNTASRQLLLSEGNRKVASVRQKQPYCDHPDRFTGWWQVLSTESLSGPCYWEVKWSGKGLCVAVACREIKRTGFNDACRFGYNDQSWALYYYNNNYHFRHNGIGTPVPGPRPPTVGVYLDHSAGILSFYSVSETMTLLHRVQTTFAQPLHAGLCLYSEVSAEICQLG